jgi:N-ethylmaleimide reductase
VRISPTNPTNYHIDDSDPETLYASVVDGLNDLDIAFLDCVEGGTGATPAVRDFDYPRLRRRFRNAYIANNGYDFVRGDAALREGRADLICFGRKFIANPDLVKRYELGAPLNDFNDAALYANDHRGYTDYPVWQGEIKKSA